LKVKLKAKRLAAEGTFYLVSVSVSRLIRGSSQIGKGDTAALTTRRPNVQMPDEYLPPNKILFLQNLPETVTKEQLTNLFNQCVFLPRHPFPG
jgi:hypothetical protein